MRNVKFFIYILLLTAAALMVRTPAYAYIYITYDEVYTGGQPAGDTPWLTALFENPGEDLMAGGYDFNSGVLLTLDSTGLAGSEFVSNWYFNLNPGLNVEDLTFTYVSGVVPGKKNVDWTSADGFKQSGKGIPLNVRIPFVTKNDSRFGDDLVSQILITGIEGLLAEDFNFSVEAKGDEYVSVAHIQGIENDPEGSAWVKGYDPPLTTVPEPSTWLLMALGLAILPIARRLGRN